MILVTGATGNVGRNVVAQLLDHGHDVRALVRRPDIAHLPGQVDVVAGDLTHPASLAAALHGVDRVFLFPVFGALRPVLTQAAAASVQQIVLLSSSAIQLPDPGWIGQVHLECEQAVIDSGLSWTFIRPGVFMANDLGWAPQIHADRTVRVPYPAAGTAPVDERDIAAVAVTALLEEHTGQIHALTGPDSLTQTQRINIIAEVTGLPLTVQEISRAAARQQLIRHLPVPAADFLLDSLATADGQNAHVDRTVQAITGAPARSYRNWAAHHSVDFTAGPTCR